MDPVEVLGWISSLILLATIVAQVRKQWRTQAYDGVSNWLYAGQIGSSCGFVAYSWFVENWVFVVTNSLLLALNIFGFFLMRHLRSQDC